MVQIETSNFVPIGAKFLPWDVEWQNTKGPPKLLEAHFLSMWKPAIFLVSSV